MQIVERTHKTLLVDFQKFGSHVLKVVTSENNTGLKLPAHSSVETCIDEILKQEQSNPFAAD
jgi:hypothetical protein